MDQLVSKANERQAMGVLPHDWVYPYVIIDSKNVITGAPFGPGADSSLFADLKKKVNALSIAEAENERLIAEGRTALVENVKPAYESIIALMAAQQKVAPTEIGRAHA